MVTQSLSDMKLFDEVKKTGILKVMLFYPSKSVGKSFYDGVVYPDLGDLT